MPELTITKLKLKMLSKELSVVAPVTSSRSAHTLDEAQKKDVHDRLRDRFEASIDSSVRQRSCVFGRKSGPHRLLH